jgi:hypothetical protein
VRKGIGRKAHRNLRGEVEIDGYIWADMIQCRGGHNRWEIVTEREEDN